MGVAVCVRSELPVESDPEDGFDGSGGGAKIGTLCNVPLQGR